MVFGERGQRTDVCERGIGGGLLEFDTGMPVAAVE